MLSQVVEGESQVHFRMHQFLARENGKPEALFYIQEGWACRYRLLSDGRRQITALYLPGDYCDPQWVLGGVSSQPVVAITNVRALRLPCRIPSRADFDGQHAFWKALAGMIERQTNLPVSLGRMTALERIAHLLCELYTRMEKIGLASNHQLEFPLTQMDLGETCGISTVHVNRILKELRRENLIAFEGRLLIFPDMVRLKSLATFDPRYLHLGSQSK